MHSYHQKLTSLSFLLLFFIFLTGLTSPDYTRKVEPLPNRPAGNPYLSVENLQYIESTKHSDILFALSKLTKKGAHFTNGTYTLASELIVPTVLAGFKRVTEAQSDRDLPLIIAVNSDKSMRNLGKKDFDPQAVRAAKVAEPLAKLFPQNQVVVIYYDEKTPHELYRALKAKDLTRTLHKWGYGTSPQEPKIEGAEFFEIVYAFPLPNDKKPVCYYDTEMPKERQKIIVDDLRDRRFPSIKCNSF